MCFNRQLETGGAKAVPQAHPPQLVHPIQALIDKMQVASFMAALGRQGVAGFLMMSALHSGFYKTQLWIKDSNSYSNCLETNYSVLKGRS